MEKPRWAGGFIERQAKIVEQRKQIHSGGRLRMMENKAVRSDIKANQKALDGAVRSFNFNVGAVTPPSVRELQDQYKRYL